MKARKILAMVMALALTAALAVGGTLAYLTSTKTVTNTFTVGNVAIKLDEAVVDNNGKALTNGTRVEGVADTTTAGNTYHLLPGHTYDKDPTVTVLKDSEESYVRMKVTVNFSSQLDAIFAPTGGANLTSIFVGYDQSNWALNGITEDTNANTRTYEFRYVGEANKGTKVGTVAAVTSDTALDDLFDQIKIPGDITNDQLATLVTKDADGKITDQFKIIVVAEAIQADGFDTADAAWEAFSKK